MNHYLQEIHVIRTYLVIIIFASNKRVVDCSTLRGARDSTAGQMAVICGNNNGESTIYFALLGSKCCNGG